MDLSIQDISHKWNCTLCGLLWLALLTLHNVFKVHPHWHVSVHHSCLLLNTLPLYGYTTFYLSIHSLMDICVVFPFSFAVNNVAMNTHKYICEDVCYSFFGQRPWSAHFFRMKHYNLAGLLSMDMRLVQCDSPCIGTGLEGYHITLFISFGLERFHRKALQCLTTILQWPSLWECFRN